MPWHSIYEGWGKEVKTVRHKGLGVYNRASA
jgi:hypothetical protein